MSEGMRISDVANLVGKSPFYLTSKNQIEKNFNQCLSAVKGLGSPLVTHKVRANENPNLLRYLGELGAGVTVCSDKELKLAIAAGINLDKIILDGVCNCKEEDLLLSVMSSETLINVGSELALNRIINVSKETKTKAKILLSMNLDDDVSSWKSSERYGIKESELSGFLETIQDNLDHIDLAGVQCLPHSKAGVDGFSKGISDQMLKVV